MGDRWYTQMNEGARNMAKNYTEEQTLLMIKLYQTNPTRETVDKLAKDMGKTVKSEGF